MRLEYAAPSHVRQVIDRLGRTEDLQFSPSGRRLALAEFSADRILILDVEIAVTGAHARVAVTDCLELASPGLHAPHGVCFMDEGTLIVANRGAGVSVLPVPPSGTGNRVRVVDDLDTMRGNKWLHSPGSVSIAPIERDRYSLLVCNNYAHYVSRHVLDARDRPVAASNEILLANGLDIPDGVAVSRDTRWIAVSSHGGHSVLLFENTPPLNLHSEPAGILVGVACPHGVRFTPDDEFVLVADAGAPYLHVYARDRETWRGRREPISSFRVMDDETFQRGRYNPEEGGPKGIDVDRQMSVLAATSEHQALAFFALPELLRRRRNPGPIPLPVAGAGAAPDASTADAVAPEGRAAPRRAAPCPCGSGRRYKHCCGMQGPAAASSPARPFESIMTQALDAQRSGSLALAETLYREALRLRPEHPDALHMLGVVCYSLARFREATRLIRQAGESTGWSLSGILHNYALALGARMLGRSTVLTAKLRLEYDRWLAQRPTDDGAFDPELLVSVVFPVRNSPRHVERALESVFAQTYPHIELVVIRDGASAVSPDAIRRQLRACPFPFQYVDGANEGVPAALNEAVRLARGAFVNPLSSDGMFPPTRIFDMVQCVVRRGFDWGFARCTGIDPARRGIASELCDRDRELAAVEEMIGSSDTVGAALLSPFNPAVSTGNMFFSKTLHERLGGFRECRSYHDWDFCLRALPIAEPCFVPAELYRCRLPDGDDIGDPRGRNPVAAAALFTDYYRSVIEKRPANRFAPTKATTGWSYIAKGLAMSQGGAIPSEILMQWAGDLESEDERTVHRVDDPRGNGLDVVGCVRGDFGPGESVRAVARTCRHAGIPASFHDADAAPGMRQSNRTLDACLTDEFSHRNALFCLNPDLLPPVWQRFADRGDLRGRRTIGFWFWEIDAFPKKWRPALDLVDEIWVASEFVGNVIRRVTDKPVIKIPHAIRASCSRRYARAEFSLPEHRFLFLFTFDFDSSFERKNPLAIVEAFGRAFPAGDDRAGLVIKCVQGHGYPEKRDRLDALAAKDPRICVLDKFLSREDVYGLQSVCDAYISLHRSEGLGLGMAECMAQGKPVIATAYSGNLEFMTRDNSCLVDFALIPVRPGEYIDYEPGWLWADPDIDQAARYMVRVRDDPDYRSRIAERAASDMATRFGDQASGAAITRRLVELAQP